MVQLYTEVSGSRIEEFHYILTFLILLPQTEDLAALAAQQYYVELGEQMIPDRLNRMIPSAIPDSLLAGQGMQDKWMQMITASFKRVSLLVRQWKLCINHMT